MRPSSEVVLIAAWIRPSAQRSLTLPLGFVPSSFARTNASPERSDPSSTVGVSPIASRTLLPRTCLLHFHVFRPAQGIDRECFDLREPLEHQLASALGTFRMLDRIDQPDHRTAVRDAHA